MNTAAAATATGTTAAADKRKQEKPYRGIRMRKWGKWVAEIREPNKRSRIWLGSYSTPVAAAMAYDTAVFYLRGPTAPLNFPDHLPEVAAATDVLSVTSPAAIRKKAAEVGARVDAIQTSSAACINKHHAVVQLQHKRKKPDLNEIPDPDENSDEDD